MNIEICVGSSCHLKNSEKIVELFLDAVTEHEIENEVTLLGSFCAGKCNRVGVRVTIDGTAHTGLTPEDFPDFFSEHVLKALK